MTPLELRKLFRREKLPLIRSAEMAECGLACLAMVGCHHGHDLDLNGLRQRFSISNAGLNLRDLVDLSRQLGMSARAVRIDLDELARLPLPAILHWNMNHFVVLKSVRGDKIVIHDPAAGCITMPIARASSSFTGVALEVTPAAEFEKVSARAPVSLASLWTRLRGGRSTAAFLLIVSLTVQALSFVAPFQIQLVIDEVVVRNNGELLGVIAAAFFLLMTLQLLLTAARDWSLQLFGNQMIMQMIGNLFRHLVRLPADYFEKRHIGDLVSRMGAARVIQDTLTQGAVTAVIDGAMAIAASIILFVYAPKLALIVFAGLVGVVLLNLALYPRQRALTESAVGVAAKEQSYLMETIRGVTTVKILGGEAQREASWRNLFVESLNANAALQRLTLWQSGLQNMIIGVQVAAVIYVAARDVLAGAGFSIGMLTAFLAFRQTFMDRTLSLIAKGQQFLMMSVHVERLGDIINQEPEPLTAEPCVRGQSRDIKVSGVSFRYGVTDRWVLQDLDLHIRDGEFLAIVGASGGGKSTLLKLLLGLQQPCSGEIHLAEQRASPERWRAWRNHMGVVTQDDRLMSGSLADNIAFFDPDMRMEQVIAAATTAQIRDDIERMPMKYQTLVGDMGSSLSGGQRQRVLLARALYRRPEILILDEGTANLDPEAEEAIAARIAAMPITRIVVAHRPALVARADRVLRLVDGRLAPYGADSGRRPSARTAHHSVLDEV